MALPPLEKLAGEKAGARSGSRTAAIDPARARAYALATNDPNPAYLDGRFAPPVFGVVPTWDLGLSALDEVVPADAKTMLLHAEQDMHFHQTLTPAMALTGRSHVHSVRGARSGKRVTVRIISDDDAGAPVLEQYCTMVVRGFTGGEDTGPDRPDHAFPDDARDNVVARVTRHIDDDQTFRYRDASGDSNLIHVDDEFARSVRLPGIILHGLCTMAMCGAAVLDEVAGGEPNRLARLAVRFSWPVFPGSDLDISIHRAADRNGLEVYAFEATSSGKVVIRDGRAEVRA